MTTDLTISYLMVNLTPYSFYVTLRSTLIRHPPPPIKQIPLTSSTLTNYIFLKCKDKMKILLFLTNHFWKKTIKYILYHTLNPIFINYQFRNKSADLRWLRILLVHKKIRISRHFLCIIKTGIKYFWCTNVFISNSIANFDHFEYRTSLINKN